MSSELTDTQWSQMKGFLRDKWNNLSDEDIRQINGRYDQLIAKLQQKYGLSKEAAEEEVRKWAAERGIKPLAMTKENAEGATSPFFKWLLAAAVALLLLLSYLGFQNSKAPENVITPTPVTQTQVATTSPSDLRLTDSINRALGADPTIAPDMSRIQISTSGGVVTIKGSVSTAQEKDAVSLIAKSISGVTQVNNQLEVK